MKKILIACAAVMSLCGYAKVVPGSLITDNMVLQQNTNARIYGSAAPGSEVTVVPTWNNKPYTAKADANGKWIVTVETPKGGYEKYSITIKDSESEATVGNILIGEVWLASGQSNMEMPLKGFSGCVVRDGYDEIAASRDRADKIRVLTVPIVHAYEPQEVTNAEWTVPSPDTAGNYSATAWYFAKRLNDVLDVPVGLVVNARGGAKVEGWTPREILETYPDVSLDKEDMEGVGFEFLQPMVIYNGMFCPVKNYTYNGIIWYQGCSNVGEDENYARRLGNMVNHWRKELALGDIPFYMVEIAPYKYDGSQANKAALLRETQWKAASEIPNSGIISTNNLVEDYERYNIHPGNKKGVGFRLGNYALNKTYGKKQFLVEPPKYKSHSFKGNEAWVAIDSPSDGICRNYMIEGFEVAGSDKVFYPADSAWLHWQTNEIVVSSKHVEKPVAVRYCWGDFMPGTVYSANFLPLVPFRTDNW